MELSRAREGSSRSQEEGDPLRGSESDMETDPLWVGNKWNNSTCEDETEVKVKMASGGQDLIWPLSLSPLSKP
ncbi:hypothetical protein HanPSC8_Chr04g0146211 [Helianthus annuus]|nr:hypothetical protein HanPSC8_Chr04g0146211 [Helianthus annuus]